jgi:hypothetical protein
MDDPRKPNRNGPQFSRRTLLKIMAVVTFVLFLFYGRESSGANRRNQVFRQPSNLGSDRDATFLYDTQTGACWIGNGEPWPTVDRKTLSIQRLN